MKYALPLFVFWFLFIVANICIADINANTRDNRIQQHITKQINHPAWALWYCLLCAPMFLWFKDWYYMGSIALLHGAILGPAYNMMGQYKAPSAWYLSPTTTAWTDKTLLKMGFKSTEAFNFACFFGSAALLVISFFQNH